ncbi:MAG: acyl-CoA dehydrogenase family protein [Mycobacteriaceae bacterium]
MDFALTDAQNDLGGLARQILTDKVTQDRLREIEKAPDRFDRALWADLADAGILAAALPETVGGGGFDALEQCSVLIELGRTVAPVPYLASIVMAASAIAHFGTAAQRTRWSAPAATGQRVLSAALTNEQASPGVHATPSGEGWVLSGTKVTVPAGMVADAFLVSATTPEGVAVFLVDVEDPGVSMQRQDMVDRDSAGWLELLDVALDRDRVLGGDGDEVVAWLVDRGTVGLCALQLGVTERALEFTAEYGRERQQFGRAIGSFQAVAQRLADAYIDVEAIRLTLWQAAWRVSEGLESGTEIATAKFWAADAGHRVAHTAVHVHGGVGIDMDYPLHRYFVAAKRNEFELGSATTQLLRIGATLATEPV